MGPTATANAYQDQPGVSLIIAGVRDVFLQPFATIRRCEEVQCDEVLKIATAARVLPVLGYIELSATSTTNEVNKEMTLSKLLLVPGMRISVVYVSETPDLVSTARDLVTVYWDGIIVQSQEDAMSTNTGDMSNMKAVERFQLLQRCCSSNCLNSKICIVCHIGITSSTYEGLCMCGGQRGSQRYWWLSPDHTVQLVVLNSSDLILMNKIQDGTVETAIQTSSTVRSYYKHSELYEDPIASMLLKRSYLPYNKDQIMLHSSLKRPRPDFGMEMESMRTTLPCLLAGYISVRQSILQLSKVRIGNRGANSASSTKLQFPLIAVVLKAQLVDDFNNNRGYGIQITCGDASASYSKICLWLRDMSSCDILRVYLPRNVIDQSTTIPLFVVRFAPGLMLSLSKTGKIYGHMGQSKDRPEQFVSFLGLSLPNGLAPDNTTGGPFPLMYATAFQHVRDMYEHLQYDQELQRVQKSRGIRSLLSEARLICDAPLTRLKRLCLSLLPTHCMQECGVGGGVQSAVIAQITRLRRLSVALHCSRCFKLLHYSFSPGIPVVMRCNNCHVICKRRFGGVRVGWDDAVEADEVWTLLCTAEDGSADCTMEIEGMDSINKIILLPGDREPSKLSWILLAHSIWDLVRDTLITATVCAGSSSVEASDKKIFKQDIDLCQSLTAEDDEGLENPLLLMRTDLGDDVDISNHDRLDSKESTNKRILNQLQYVRKQFLNIKSKLQSGYASEETFMNMHRLVRLFCAFAIAPHVYQRTFKFIVSIPLQSATFSNVSESGETSDNKSLHTMLPVQESNQENGFAYRVHTSLLPSRCILYPQKTHFLHQKQKDWLLRRLEVNVHAVQPLSSDAGSLLGCVKQLLQQPLYT